MNELTDFLTKLGNSDLIVLTHISNDRTYCRFFQSGVYTGRLYVSDPAILAELQSLIGEGEEVGAEGIAKLRQFFLAV